MKFSSLRSVPALIALSTSKGQRILSSQKGVALVITLLVLTLLITLILEFSNTMRIEARAAANFRDDIKANYIARAGVEFARGVLEEDKRDVSRNYDALTENWAQRLPPIPLGDGTVLVEITDEEGKININELGLSLTVSSALNDMLLSLLTNLGVNNPQVVLNSILDWSDPDSDDNRPQGGGAETPYYEALDDSYPARNTRPIDSIEELRLIRGVDDDTFNRLKNFLTVHGRGASINVNTAPREVLRAISNDLTDQGIDEIINDRKDDPIETNTELKDALTLVGGMDPVQTYSALSTFVTVESQVFSIRSQGEVNGVRKTIHAVVERAGTGASVKTIVLYWRVE